MLVNMLGTSYGFGSAMPNPYAKGKGKPTAGRKQYLPSVAFMGSSYNTHRLVGVRFGEDPIIDTETGLPLAGTGTSSTATAARHLRLGDYVSMGFSTAGDFLRYLAARETSATERARLKAAASASDRGVSLATIRAQLLENVVPIAIGGGVLVVGVIAVAMIMSRKKKR